MMTKKDYVRFAELIHGQVEEARHMPPAVADRELGVLVEVAVGMVRVFRADNPRFDRDQFMAACGLGQFAVVA